MYQGIFSILRAPSLLPTSGHPAIRALLIFPLIVFSFVLGVTLITFLTQQTQPLAASPLAQQSVPQLGGFVPDGESVRSTDADALAPALAIPPDSVEPWVAVRQNNRLYVSKFMTDTATWVQQGGILNRGSANPAADPALVFAGDATDVPWAAWREETEGVQLINASSYNGTAWNLTPVINRDATHDALSPRLAAGSTVSGTTPLPWLTWAEADAAGVFQIVVSAAVPDTRVQGDFAWEAVGDALNLDSTRAGREPDLAFAGPGSTVLWVVWTEEGDGRAVRVFAKRWNGTSWDAVGRQSDCSDEIGCALNIDANHDATGARIGVGTLPNQRTPSPWIVFSEMGIDGQRAIHVMRLDVGALENPADDRFVAVGGALNAQCLGNAGISSMNAQNGADNSEDRQRARLHDASDPASTSATSGGNAIMPDIYFVGNVPHVTWVEQSAGRAVLHVCHLADARSGFERWDLDDIDGINRSSGAASAPSLATTGLAPYVAWQESLMQSMTNTVTSSMTETVYVSHRAPPRAAWAMNFPSVVSNVSGTAVSVEMQRALLAQWGQGAAAVTRETTAPLLRSVGVPITTAAYHVNGSARLEEVHFQLTSSSMPTGTAAFMARYVISENLVYVQDPENPGTFFTPVTPGATANVNTPVVTLKTSDVAITTHGAPSAALDVQWSLIFEDPTFFKHYDQAVNIIYDSGQETGFFKVGTVYVGNLIYLPIVFTE